jgi:transposase-like protein
MQDQLDIVKEVISSFLKDRKEGKKDLVEWFLNNVMEEEARMQISADPYERSEDRKAHRNGIRKRTLKTLEGNLELNKPQIREFPFKTNVFERYLKNVSASYLSSLSSELDVSVKEFIERKIESQWRSYT